MAEKHETTKHRLYLLRLQRETLWEPSPVASPTSPTSPTPPPWRRGSTPPLDYGFVVVDWSLSLSCAMLIICHMSCLTWLWSYYVIPMWWILILLDDLWDVNLYHNLDVWIDAYCYPVLITCSGQTCMQEHVWGMMCVRWSNLVVVVDCDSNFVAIMVFTNSVVTSLGKKRRHVL
jgi:hypothetical protein